MHPPGHAAYNIRTHFSAVFIFGLLFVVLQGLVRMNADQLFYDMVSAEEISTEDIRVATAPSPALIRVTGAMDAGAYLDTGLGIGTLAEQVGLPEHQLRKLINPEMGFRNFTAFVNSYRLADAKRRLAADAHSTPILTIAMELGYGSIPSFNRAFKADTGMTPSQWRESHIMDGRKTPL